MRITVAVDARSLVLVDTAADRPQLATVALAAAVCVGQRLDAALVTLVHDVRMTLTTCDVRVRRRRVFDVVMTSETILQGLSAGER